MYLHVWHAASSSVGSEDKLSSSCLIFVNISEMSNVIPVATQHPVLLDVATKDTMMRTGEPMAPLSFRGFRLHTVWTRQSGGDLVCQVIFPCFLGEATISMLEYEPEKFPQGLMQGPKMAINLRPPSGNHWNITSDLILPLAVDTFRRRCEAKCTAQGLEGESVGAKVSPKDAPALGGLLKLWRVAAELRSQHRPLTRAREPWRLHAKFWNTFTPSVSRPCMKWGA